MDRNMITSSSQETKMAGKYMNALAKGQEVEDCGPICSTSRLPLKSKTQVRSKSNRIEETGEPEFK